MLGNCEKMVVIPSTTNEWPESQIDEKGLIMASSAAASSRVMEKPSQDQQPQPLKCPRCDSSNTKFCYYNNYSLSQPRHFCKACKRYWTRGGTLRNVPVGGGCRKNKRIKRPNSSSAGEVTSSSTTPSATTNPSVQTTGHIDLSSSAASHINHPLFYSLLTTNPSDLNLPPYPRFNSRVSNIDSASGFDHLQTPQMNGTIGLGFSSGLLANDDGFPPVKQIQDVVSSNSTLLSSYPIFGSTSTTMASLIPSSLHHQQQKLISGGFKDNQLATNGFHQVGSYEDVVQVPIRNAEGCLMVKDVKIEDGHNRLEWNNNVTNHHQNHIEQINSSDASLLWNATGLGAWLDPSNIGSSVPSLI